jgi:hypothetical protein
LQDAYYFPPCAFSAEAVPVESPVGGQGWAVAIWACVHFHSSFLNFDAFITFYGFIAFAFAGVMVRTAVAFIIIPFFAKLVGVDLIYLFKITQKALPDRNPTRLGRVTKVLHL